MRLQLPPSGRARHVKASTVSAMRKLPRSLFAPLFSSSWSHLSVVLHYKINLTALAEGEKKIYLPEFKHVFSSFFI